jgi:transcriptional regulator with PAS, ATPase and Fis domain
MNTEELDFTNAEMLRKTAEKQLKEKQAKNSVPVTEIDIKKLVHELQVHQIELEMQNEELLASYHTAETALKKYTMLYDFAPMGYLTLDSDGSICELNFTAAEMLKDKRFSLVGSNFKIFVSNDSKKIFSDFLAEVYSSDSKESCEIMLGCDNNNFCRVYVEGIVMGDEHKCLLSIVDISSFIK